MKILLDESLPRSLRLQFAGHEVSTVQEMGWAGTRHGELLALAQEDFEVFVTADQNLEYQQNLSSVDIAISVLAAPTNRLDDILPLLDKIEDSLSVILPGQLMRIPK